MPTMKHEALCSQQQVKGAENCQKPLQMAVICMILTSNRPPYIYLANVSFSFFFPTTADVLYVFEVKLRNIYFGLQTERTVCPYFQSVLKYQLKETNAVEHSLSVIIAFVLCLPLTTVFVQLSQL